MQGWGLLVHSSAWLARPVGDGEQQPSSFKMCRDFKPMRLLLLLLVTCSSSILAQQLPPAPRAHVSDVTPKAGYFNEPAITVNPKNPQEAVVAWQVPASAAYSKDGGQTWKVAEGLAPGMYRVSGDVSLAYDAAGHAILCYIAFDKLGSTNYWAQGISFGLEFRY